MKLELVSARGEPSQTYALDSDTAVELLDTAARTAAEHGLPWTREPIRLKPSKKLADLIAKSRRLAAEGGADSEG